MGNSLLSLTIAVGVWVSLLSPAAAAHSMPLGARGGGCGQQPFRAHGGWRNGPERSRG